MKYCLFLLFLSTFLFLGCKKIEKPQFKSIQNIEISEITKDNASLQADLLLHNPNIIGYAIESIDIKVFSKGKELTHISQAVNARFEPESDLHLPVKLAVPLDKILSQGGLLTAIQSFVEKKITLEFKGDIKISSAGISLKVPFEEEREVFLHP